MIDNMRAVEISKIGGPEVLSLVSLPIPEPGLGDVLIENFAAGINRPDCLQRAGRYDPPPDANPLPGLEVAGKIIALGNGADRWKIGDRVCALVHGGGYAEFTLAHQDHCLPWPKGYDAIMAAALPENFFTVYDSVFTRAGLERGETFLVHGGSSGIGLSAIQLAHANAIKVITTAGSDEKCRFCRAAGADHAINYKTENWPEQVRQITNGNGVNVILDMVAGSYTQKNLNLLARDGRYVFIAFMGGARTELKLTPILMNRLTIMGLTLRSQTIAEKSKIANNLLCKVWPLLENGTISPYIFKTFPLFKARQAHQLMETSSHIGKLILNIKDESIHGAYDEY